MSQLLKIIKKRTSIRKYKQDDHLTKEQLNQILQAGLLAPTSRNLKSCEFICVTNKDLLNKLSMCKNAGASMLKEADAAIVVIGNHQQCDVWVEDCSIAMAHMHLMATELNIGSCWIQCRLRNNTNYTAEDYIQNLFNIPKRYSVLAILSLGKCEDSLWKEHSLDEKDIKRIHKIDKKGNVIW